MKTKTAAEQRIRRLYHYQSLEKPERLERILSDWSLYFSKPRDFNDPWDCQPFFDKSFLDYPEEREKAIHWFATCARAHGGAIAEEEHLRREAELRHNRNLLESFIDQMTSEIGEAIQKQYRVYCLSLHPNSTLMWAHYAASCRGVCLEFSVQNELFCGALPIEYSLTYPTHNVAATDDDANLRPLLVKSAAWEYEKEFRLIATEHPIVFPDVPVCRNGLLPLPADSLKAVIVGAGMTHAERQIVKDLAAKAKYPINLKVANLVPNRYEFSVSALI